MSLEYIFAYGLVSYIGKEQTEWEDKKYQRGASYISIDDIKRIKTW